ncbi:MAG: winged helix-turn-helix domain-containing protein [Schwartzia sp. (in: firmicutes)]
MGGSANINEIRDETVEMLHLSDEVVDEQPSGNASQQIELEYQLAWACIRLKTYGAIINRKRGVWMITPAFADREIVTREEITKFIKNPKLTGTTESEATEIANDDDPTNNNIGVPEELEPWRVELTETLHNMDPFDFDRLSVLLLRECGFSQVSVTKRLVMVVLMEQENYV